MKPVASIVFRYCTSELAHAAAPPFQFEPATLGFDLVLFGCIFRVMHTHAITSSELTVIYLLYQPERLSIWKPNGNKERSACHLSAGGIHVFMFLWDFGKTCDETVEVKSDDNLWDSLHVFCVFTLFSQKRVLSAANTRSGEDPFLLPVTIQNQMPEKLFMGIQLLVFLADQGKRNGNVKASNGQITSFGAGGCSSK